MLITSPLLKKTIYYQSLVFYIDNNSQLSICFMITTTSSIIKTMKKYIGAIIGGSLIYDLTNQTIYIPYIAPRVAKLFNLSISTGRGQSMRELTAERARAATALRKSSEFTDRFKYARKEYPKCHGPDKSIIVGIAKKPPTSSSCDIIISPSKNIIDSDTIPITLLTDNCSLFEFLLQSIIKSTLKLISYIVQAIIFISFW